MTRWTPLRPVGRFRPDRRFPALEQFFGAYFHQDWPVEHATAADVLRAAIETTTTEDLRAVRRELASVLDACSPEADLRRVADEWRVEYVPEADGLGMREWLEHVLDFVEADEAARM